MSEDVDMRETVRVAGDSANSYDYPRIEFSRAGDEIEIITERPQRTIRVSAESLARAIKFLTQD